MATAIAPPSHPYIDEIGRLFYNYRLAQFNRRYYTVLLARVKRKNLFVQVLLSLFTVSAFALFSLAPSFPKLSEGFGRVASVFSALAFVLSVAAPVFGLSQRVEELTTRIHA